MPSLNQDDDGADSDTSLSWEEFFGSTTAEDLVPTLLSMYDALVGRGQTSNVWRCEEESESWRGETETPPRTWCSRVKTTSPAAGSWGHDREPRPPQEPPPPPRPLSVSSIASSSSSSTSSVTSSSGSSGARRLTKGSAYLASIESLEDTDDEVDRLRTNRLQDSGLCSPCSYISPPCPPSSKPKYCNPNLSYMDRVVMEVIETEGVYVSHLKEVIIGYLERWETSPDCPLTPIQLSDLFGNLKEIYNFNSSFLKELEQCELDPVKIARVFVKNKPGFAVYTEYCTNYPRTVGVLTELMSEESKVRLFRERQSALLHTLPLGSYLLKPVQRILKYHLLLQNIVKHSKPDSESYADIVEALSGMTSIAHHINDMKRKHEHAVRVQEIQSLLLDWQGEDLTRFGELCAEGTFGMAGAKAHRHLFLFDKILLITKKKEEGILGYKTHIMCSNLMLIESVPGEPLSFHVIPFDNPRLQYTLQAKSLEQKREWMLQLKRVILENYNAVIPSHARQLVMELGQNHTEDELVAEKVTPKRQHSAPEYLERRKQERRKSEGGPGLRARLRTRARKTSDIVAIIKSEQRLLRRGSQQPAASNDRILSTPDHMEENGLIRRQSEPAGCFLPESTRSVEQINETHLIEQQISETDYNSEEVSQQPKEKKNSLEEIVSQLLMQNKEFQRVLKKQRHVAKRCKVETSDEEDEGLGSRSRSLSSRTQKDGDYDNLQNVWERGSDPLKRTQSFSASQSSSREIPAIVLSTSSTSFEEPTSPAVWLKQQREHLAVPNHKAGSLPRGFQLGGAPDWHRTARVSPERPFTIASDKAQELNLEDMQHYVDSGTDIRLHRFPVPDDTTTEDDTTPDTSTHNLSIHPEYKIYRSSLTMATLKNVLSSVSGKLASLRLSSETLDQIETEHRTNKILSSFTKVSRHKKNKNNLPVYKQGSSGLGARIAHGVETSDYADPRTLFPNITQSKKAASLLGIRPYSVLSLASNMTSSSGYSGSTSSSNPNKDLESDENSADSFYERSFDALESNLETEVCRDSAIFSDPEEIMVIEQSVKKIPPPVPEKPSKLSWRLCENKKTVPSITPTLPSPEPYVNFSPDKVEDEYDSSSVASTVIEAAAPKGGGFRNNNLEVIGLPVVTCFMTDELPNLSHSLEKASSGVLYIGH